MTQQEEFYSILAAGKLTAYYQPIVSLSDGRIYGYEALARGPASSELAMPDQLWAVAEQEKRLYALETLARKRAVEGFAQANPAWKLFINLNANVIYDPQFTPGQTLALLKEHGLTPDQIVFEITERQSITDFAAFKQALSHYRCQGYKIAIDDAGAGYSSLQAIAELRPDYIKIDRSIIRGVDRDDIKAILLETMAVFARKIGCQLVAEGIETFAELEAVTALGVPLGQGYVFARPQPGLPSISADVLCRLFEQKIGKNLLMEASG